MLKDKKAVIFDLDGTLVDSMGIWGKVDIVYLGAYGLEVPEDLQREIEGMGFTEVAVYFKERFGIPESIETIKQTWNRMAMEEYAHRVPLKPGAGPFLSWLREQDIPAAVASSNSRELIEAALAGHGIREDFACIVTACDVHRGKPAPDVYLAAARELGIPPEDCLVFEDIVPGIQAGKAAGMTVCAVDDTYSIFQEKEKRAEADYYIYSYRQVLEGTYETCRAGEDGAFGSSVPAGGSAAEYKNA
ncbi:MAG: HAD family phosphatase [Clostridiales bacterium]|nr:HAD family phosphatase [Clostridiales bacterium]